MWGKYIVEILSVDKPIIKAVNPTSWIKKTDYREQHFKPLQWRCRPAYWSLSSPLTRSTPPRALHRHQSRVGWCGTLQYAIFEV